MSTPTRTITFAELPEGALFRLASPLSTSTAAAGAVFKKALHHHLFDAAGNPAITFQGVWHEVPDEPSWAGIRCHFSEEVRVVELAEPPEREVVLTYVTEDGTVYAMPNNAYAELVISVLEHGDDLSTAVMS
jgi:hypothetical protein